MLFIASEARHVKTPQQRNKRNQNKLGISITARVTYHLFFIFIFFLGFVFILCQIINMPIIILISCLFSLSNSVSKDSSDESSDSNSDSDLDDEDKDKTNVIAR